MTIFINALKRIACQPVNWVIVAVFPIVFVMIVTINVNTNNDESWVDMVDSINIPFGIVDQDQTVLSRTLVTQMEERFTIRELDEDGIVGALTSNDAVYVLVIRQGYSENVLAGVAPQLNGYSLTMSDISIMGRATAQNITMALMLLGTDDPAVISSWQEAAQFEVSTVGEANNLAFMLQNLGMFGFIAMFMAFFVVRELLDDKRHGMPMRLGVLPVSTRKVIALGTLAAFAVTMVSVVVLQVTLHFRLGAAPNPLHMFVIIGLYNLFSVAFVLAVVSCVKNLGMVPFVTTIVANLSAMLGGLFWPLEMVPPFMQRVAWFSPGYWLSRGIRNIQNISFEGFWMPVLFLIGFTVVTILLGSWRNIQPVEE